MPDISWGILVGAVLLVSVAALIWVRLTERKPESIPDYDPTRRGK